MLDLLDVVKRIGPKFPLGVAFLDMMDPEWDDDMTFLQVDHKTYHQYARVGAFVSIFLLYNYNAFFHNKNFAFATKAYLGCLWFSYQSLYFKYRKQVLRCNLFDEYVQLRADELIKEREPLLKSPDFKRWVWYCADLKETLRHVHR